MHYFGALSLFSIFSLTLLLNFLSQIKSRKKERFFRGYLRQVMEMTNLKPQHRQLNSGGSPLSPLAWQITADPAQRRSFIESSREKIAEEIDLPACLELSDSSFENSSQKYTGSWRHRTFKLLTSGQVRHAPRVADSNVPHHRGPQIGPPYFLSGAPCLQTAANRRFQSSTLAAQPLCTSAVCMKHDATTTSVKFGIDSMSANSSHCDFRISRISSYNTSK